MIRDLQGSLLLFFLFLATAAHGQVLNNASFENSHHWWFPVGPVQLTTVEGGYDSTPAVLVERRDVFWNGIGQNITGKLTPDTDYHIQAWVKTQGAPEGVVRLQINQRDDRGLTFIIAGEVLAVENEWTLLEGGFRYQENGEVTELHLTVNGLHEDTSLHSFLLDNVSFTENDWEAAANARIELHRKRDVQLNFVRSSGARRSDLEFEVQQIGHHFPFGSTLNHESVTTEPLYQHFFVNNFDWATIEWRAQWKPIEMIRGIEDYSKTDISVQFAKENGISLRGHGIAWANEDFLPWWIGSLDAAELQVELEDRVDNVVSRYKGDLVHWDVNNEMLDFSFFQDRLGAGIRPWIFQQARLNDSNVKLFTNEYGIHQSAYKAARYRDMVLDLELAGAEVDGIGLQSHFFEGNTSPKSLEISLKELTPLGKQIWVTEFDSVNPDDDERAKCLETFYRYMFSRPEIHGIIMWGFWEGSHWLGADASLVDADWTINAAGQAYQDLKTEWTTSETGSVSNGKSEFDFRGFHGRYLVKVTDPATTVSNWHLIPVVPDESGDMQSVELVVSGVQDSLTIYGSDEDDLFEMDLSYPGMFVLNGVRQFLPIWEQVSQVNFEGRAGEDQLWIESESDSDEYFRLWHNRIQDSQNRFAIGYSNLEKVNLNLTGDNETAHFLDSAGDDHFELRSDSATMSFANGVQVEATNFKTCVGRSVVGNDTLEMFDSSGDDIVQTNFSTITIRDASGTVRRADQFKQSNFVSESGSDRIVYKAPVNTSTVYLGAGDVSATVGELNFHFEDIWYTNFFLAENNNAQVTLGDSMGDDVFRINVDQLEMYGPDSRMKCSGITSASISTDKGGNDLLILRDSNGDDQLTANASTVTIAGDSYDFSLQGFDTVRCFSANGGTNSATILNPEFDIRLIGDW